MVKAIIITITIIAGLYFWVLGSIMMQEHFVVSHYPDQHILFDEQEVILKRLTVRHHKGDKYALVYFDDDGTITSIAYLTQQAFDRFVQVQNERMKEGE